MTVDQYDPYTHAWLERWRCPDCEWDCMCDANHVRCNGLEDAYHHEASHDR